MKYTGWRQNDFNVQSYPRLLGGDEAAEEGHRLAVLRGRAGVVPRVVCPRQPWGRG